MQTRNHENKTLSIQELNQVFTMISKLRLLYFTPNSHPQNFGQLYKQLFHELFIYKNNEDLYNYFRPIILIKYKHCQQYQI